MRLALALLALGALPAAAEEPLPPRVRRIVLHVLGGPMYDRPELRFAFLTPPETQALWPSYFGAHWIVWTDGTLWPRHPRPGEPRSRPLPAADASAERRRLALEAAPAYAHAFGYNADTVGIELSHTGRSGDAYPEAQIRGLAWLLKTLLEMSEGRLTAADIVGHKDLDRRPAYADKDCEHAGCPVFVDDAGRPFRRRVDPPESLFVRLRQEGLDVPRPADGDKELLRAEKLGPGVRPATRQR
jgi:N-acetylmuramoyl-L-alanine amidase-like protein